MYTITQTDKHRIAHSTVAKLSDRQCKEVLKAYGIKHFNKRYLRNQTEMVIAMSPVDGAIWQEYVSL